MVKNVTSFPDHFVDPSQKGESWILQFSKACADDWENNSWDSFANGQERYHTNRLYSQGNPPIDQYKKRVGSDDDENQSYMNIDFTPVAVIPKYRRITLDKIGKIRFDPDAQAVDPLALKEKKNYESDEKANILLRDTLKPLGIDHSVLDTDEVDQPATNEELTIKMEYGYKHNQAIDVEKRVKEVFEMNRIDEQRRRVREDLFDFGVAGFIDWTDPITGEVMFRPINPANMIVSYTNDPDFRDIFYAGEYILVSIEEIRRASNGAIGEEALEEIANSMVGKYGNPKSFAGNNRYGKGYDDIKVQVLDLRFKTIDRHTYEKRITKRGNPVIGKTSIDARPRKGKEIMYDDRYTWYESKWIVGTNFIYDYGVSNDQKKKNSVIWDSIPPVHIKATEMYNMKTTSIVDHLKPLADAIMLAWLKLQNTIANARPKGILIEIESLENVSFGDGEDGKLHPLELLDLFTQTGNMVYRRVDPSGNMSQHKPIEELNNGIGAEAREWFGVINSYFQYVKDILGYNEVTDGSAPDPRMLKSVAEKAVMSTSDAIHFILDAERSLLVRLAESVVIRVHDTIAFGTTDIYDEMIGAKGLKSIKENKDILYREFAVHLKDRPTEDQLMRFEQDLEIAIKSGQITIADKIRLKNIPNLKQAEMLLAFMVKTNMGIKRKEELENIEKNAEVQKQSSIIAEEEKRKTVQIETESKAMLIRLEKEEERKTLELKYKLERQMMPFQEKIDQGKELLKGKVQESLNQQVAEQQMTQPPL